MKMSAVAAAVPVVVAVVEEVAFTRYTLRGIRST